MLKIYCYLFISLLWGDLYAQSIAQKLDQRFAVFTADPQTKYATAALCVLDAETGTQVYGKNENIGVSTASTLKTITSATAFSLLGKDFHYETTLGYKGQLVDGILKGDLIISGGGDPTLGSWRYEKTKESYVLNAWVIAIKAAGIRKVEGKIIGDNSKWDSQSIPDGWIWQDIGNYYGAGPAALSWRENQFGIKLSAGRQVSVLRTVPKMPYLKIVSELKPGAAGTGDHAYVYLPPMGTTAHLRGTWAIGINKTGVAAALPDPAYDAAYRLQDTLQRIGISFTELPTSSQQDNRESIAPTETTQTLSTLSSPPLSEIIYWLNKKSVNLYAEHMVRTLAWKAGQAATNENGVLAIQNYWASKGIDKNTLNLMDGSGLSPGTRVTAATMAKVLYLSQKETWFPDFYDSLPDHNGMKIKSGTISDVSAFAGYYYAPNGKKYVVVINVNNYSGRGINPKLFRVLNALK